MKSFLIRIAIALAGGFLLGAAPAVSAQEYLNPKDIQASPQRFWLRTYLFKDILEAGPAAMATVDFSDKPHYQMSTKGFKVAYANEDAKAGLKGLPTGREYLFQGTVQNKKGKYYYTITAVLDVKQDPSVVVPPGQVEILTNARNNEALAQILYNTQASMLLYAKNNGIPFSDLFNPESPHSERAIFIVRDVVNSFERTETSPGDILATSIKIALESYYTSPTAKPVEQNIPEEALKYVETLHSQSKPGDPTPGKQPVPPPVPTPTPEPAKTPAPSPVEPPVVDPNAFAKPKDTARPAGILGNEPDDVLEKILDGTKTDGKSPNSTPTVAPVKEVEKEKEPAKATPGDLTTGITAPSLTGLAPPVEPAPVPSPEPVASTVEPMPAKEVPAPVVTPEPAPAAEPPPSPVEPAPTVPAPATPDPDQAKAKESLDQVITTEELDKLMKELNIQPDPNPAAAPAPEVVTPPADPAPVVAPEPAPAVAPEAVVPAPGDPAPAVVPEPAPAVVPEAVVPAPAPVDPAPAVVPEPAPVVVPEAVAPAPAPVDPAPAVVPEPAPAVVPEAVIPVPTPVEPAPAVVPEPAPAVVPEAVIPAPAPVEPAPAVVPEPAPVVVPEAVIPAPAPVEPAPVVVPAPAPVVAPKPAPAPAPAAKKPPTPKAHPENKAAKPEKAPAKTEKKTLPVKPKEEPKPAPPKKDDGLYDPDVDFHFKNLPK